MDELIEQITRRFGIPAATARGVVEMVLGFVKDRLPEPIAGQIDGLLSGGGLGQAEQLLGGLGDLLGQG